SSLFRFLKSSITLAAAIQALGPVRVESSVLSHGFPLRRICTSPLLNSYKYFSSIMICSDMFSPYFRLCVYSLERVSSFSFVYVGLSLPYHPVTVTVPSSFGYPLRIHFNLSA